MVDEENIKCTVHDCENDAEWTFGSLRGFNLVYCEDHKEWGEYVIINLKESVRVDRKPGDSPIGHEKVFGSHEKEKIIAWLKKWRERSNGNN